MPADTYSVPSYFASNCPALTSFEFEEPGGLSYDQALGNCILDGASITSITFPKSLTSLNSFSNYTLQGLDQLKEIHFNGIPYSKLAGEVQPSIPDESEDEPEPEYDFKYAMNKLYYVNTLEQGLKWAKVDTSITVSKNSGEILNMMKDTINSHVPVVAIVSGNEFFSNGKPECSHC